MRTPNLKSLRMFEAAARHLNFQHAADELHLTQGAVAQQVRGLEKALGQALFKRLARGLSLTPVGRQYHGSIAEALHIIDQATARIQPQGARVTLSVTPSFASKWLVPRLQRFSELHPSIELNVVATERLSDLKRDAVDVAVRHAEDGGEADDSLEYLAALKLCAVAAIPPGNTAPKAMTLETLLDQRLIADAHPYWRVLFEEIGAKVPDKLLTFDQTALAIDAAINGQGVVIAPRILVEKDVQAGRLGIVWQDPHPARSAYYLLYPQGKSLRSGCVALVQWLRAEISA